MWVKNMVIGGIDAVKTLFLVDAGKPLEHALSVLGLEVVEGNASAAASARADVYVFDSERNLVSSLRTISEAQYDSLVFACLIAVPTPVVAPSLVEYVIADTPQHQAALLVERLQGRKFF